MLKSDWNATQFFSELLANNKLAIAEGFTFCKVSGLEGFEEALHAMQQATAFCCVSDIADGYTELNNTPRTRRIKTVFLAMRHAIDDMDARNECMEIMRELFRQLMSVLTLERVKLEQNCIYLDPRISFNEIDRYFFSGCACAYFQVAVDVFTDLRTEVDKWDTEFIVKYVPGTRFDVWLMAGSVNYKANIIKYISNAFEMTFTDAVALYNKAPCLLVANVSIDDALKHKSNLEAFNAEIKILSNGTKP